MEQHSLDFLAGGGEMGERVRAFDWSQNPVGPVEEWPQSLRTAVSICLNSRFPIVLWWGPQLRMIYNDAWRPSLGTLKHPALGKPGQEVWGEIWHLIGPMLESVLATGDATWSDDQLLPMDRHGYLEETYWTYSYSPIRDGEGRIGGVFTAVSETTLRVIGERRLRTLRELSAQAATARTPEETARAALRTLAGNPADVPFALLYFVDEGQQRARLCGCTPLAEGTAGSPTEIDLTADGASPWPLAEVVRSGQPLVVDDVPARCGDMPRGPLPVDPQQAIVLPLRTAAQDRVAGVLVLGVNPARALDEEHRSFHDLAAGHIATAIANARAYEEERQRAEALAELDRAKTAFFSNVSHEFRTPLTLMLGPVEDMLARSYTELSPAVKGQLEVVNRNGLRLLRLVNSLLDFSRIEAGRVRAAYQPTDLAAFTGELASVFRAAVERAGLRLVVDCPPLAEPAYVDRDMWEKIVLNLLSNAFKFTFEGEIAVTLRQTGKSAELQVRDTGTGIPAEEMPRLFERFHRIENARGRTHEGSGIGLALVQELVKLHGGSIGAESVIGTGTTFTVTLPLGADHLPADQIGDHRSLGTSSTGAVPYVEEALRWLPEPARPGSETPWELPHYQEPVAVPAVSAQVGPTDTRPRVLVADDNADMRQYITRLLAESYQVEAAADGEAALAAVHRQPPDLILSDVMMPRLDGFGLLRELRADPRTSGLPVIMLSARAGEESRVEGMEAGADDYLVKPFSARELLARVGAHLQMARLRREAAESLRQGEERLRMALTAARMVAWQWHPVEDQVYLSENAADVFGLSPGSTFETSEQGFATLHPDDVERHRATIRKAIEACGSYHSQFRMVRPDNGKVIWLEERGNCVGQGPGETEHLVGVVMDITDRKQADEALHKEREWLSVTLASIGDAVVATDEQGRVTLLNGVAQSLTGWTQEDAAGQPLATVFSIINEYTRQPVENPVEKVLREGRIVGLANHTILIARDGTERPIDDSAAPIRDGAGAIIGVVLIFRDVTEPRETERRIRESEQRYRLIGDAANDAIWDWDLVTNQVVWNEGVRTRFGYTAGQVGPDATWWYDQIHPEDQERVVHGIHAAIDGGQTQWQDEYRFRRADGTDAFVFDRGRIVHDESGRPTRMIGSMLDLTERKRAEEELRQVAADLSEANRRKTEFLATLGHELRNPLAPIRTGLELLKSLEDDPVQREETRSMMERQALQMVRLIDDLLDMSRITQGKLQLRTCRVALAEIVQSAIEATRPFIDEAGHWLTVQLPEEPVYLDADPNRLAQVFSNLLNNSTKYTPEGGHLWLTAEQRDGEVVVIVRDDGIGIPAELQAGIFEMFNQIDRSLEKGYQGLGIGLTLVKQLVEMHGGTVKVYSEGTDRGSEFSVRLPTQTEAPVSADQPAATQAAAKKKRLRILVVDDNKAAADMLAMVVKMLGNDVRVAYNGTQGVAKAAEFRPEVVLMDLGMPSMNGYEAAQHIRDQEWGGSMLLVALTGWGQEEDRRRAREAGFDHHLVKPAEPAELRNLFASINGSG